MALQRNLPQEPNPPTRLHYRLSISVNGGQDGVHDAGPEAGVRENGWHWDDFPVWFRVYHSSVSPVPRLGAEGRPELPTSVLAAELDHIEEPCQCHPFTEPPPRANVTIAVSYRSHRPTRSDRSRKSPRPWLACPRWYSACSFWLRFEAWFRVILDSFLIRFRLGFRNHRPLNWVSDTGGGSIQGRSGSLKPAPPRARRPRVRTATMAVCLPNLRSPMHF